MSSILSSESRKVLVMTRGSSGDVSCLVPLHDGVSLEVSVLS